MFRVRLQQQPRSSIRVGCMKDKMGVFQIRPDVPVSLQNARDAKEYCHTYDHVPKNDVYAIYGVDGEMVQKYLHVVEDLERSYDQAVINVSKEASLIKVSLWGYTLWISKD